MFDFMIWDNMDFKTDIYTGYILYTERSAAKHFHCLSLILLRFRFISHIRQRQIMILTGKIFYQP